MVGPWRDKPTDNPKKKRSAVVVPVLKRSFRIVQMTDLGKDWRNCRSQKSGGKSPFFILNPYDRAKNWLWKSRAKDLREGSTSAQFPRKDSKMRDAAGSLDFENAIVLRE